MPSPIVTASPREGQRERRWRRPVGGLGCLAIGLALASRTDGIAMLLCGLAGIILVGTATFHGRPRRLARFLALNLALLALVGWSLTERSELVVEVEGNRVEARLGGVRLVGTAGFTSTDTVGLSLGAAEERPFVARWAYQPRSWLEDVGLWFSTNVASGVSDVAVTAPDGAPLAPTTATVWQPLRDRDPLRSTAAPTGWQARYDRDGDVELTLPNLARQDFQVTATLLRPGPDVQVVIRPQAGNPVAVRASPDRRTFDLVELIGDDAERPLVGGLFVYRRSAAEWGQTLLRELSRPWLIALALLGAANLLAVRLPHSFEAPVPLTRAQSIVTAGFLGLAASMLAWLVASVLLERIPHVQDSVTYLFQAEVFARGRLWVPAPAQPEFFAQEFVLARDGRWFGKYPPGQPLLLALGVLVGAPWIVSPIASGLTVGLVYLSGRRLYGDGVGALAAALLVLSPFFLMLAGEMMAHPAGLLWTSLLLYAAVVCWQGGNRLAWLVAGVAFGMLFITRQLTALAVGAALLAVIGAAALRAPRRLPVRAALLLVGFLPPLAFLAYFNQTLTGSPLVSPFELWWDFDRVGFGRALGMHGGHDVANGLANTFANLSELFRHLYGWPAYLALALALVPFAVASRTLWDWVLLGSAAGLIVGYVFYWADGIMYGPRYYYEALAPLALLTARGAALLADLPRRRAEAAAGAGTEAAIEDRDTWTMSARPAVFALLACLLAGNVLGYLPAILASTRGYNGVSRAPLARVEASSLGSALVFVRQEWPDWQPYGAVFPANGPLLDNDVIYALDLGSLENRRLMNAYPDRLPYLLDGLTLTEIRR